MVPSIVHTLISILSRFGSNFISIIYYTVRELADNLSGIRWIAIYVNNSIRGGHHQHFLSAKISRCYKRHPCLCFSVFLICWFCTQFVCTFVCFCCAFLNFFHCFWPHLYVFAQFLCLFCVLIGQIQSFACAILLFDTLSATS